METITPGRQRDAEGNLIGYVPWGDLDKVNTGDLRKAYEFAVESWRAQDGRWDQGVYYVTDQLCGTAYCLAGYTAIELMGAIPIATDDFSWMVKIPSGEESADLLAQKYLGLCRCDANDLFDGYNTIHDLRIIVSALLREDLPELEVANE